jgi:hypothetical protein
MGKHELVYCEDFPTAALDCYRCEHCEFVQSAAITPEKADQCLAEIQPVVEVHVPAGSAAADAKSVAMPKT